MKLALDKLYVFLAAGVIYLLGQYLRGFWFPLTTWPLHCYLATWGSQTLCDPQYLSAGFTLISLGKWLLPVALILLFADERGFRRWLKFSAWYAPIALVIIFAIFPVALPVGASLDSASAARDLAILYALITLIIIPTARLRGREAAQ